jgi:hypothetical protein
MAALNQAVFDSRDNRSSVIAFPASAPTLEGVSA